MAESFIDSVGNNSSILKRKKKEKKENVVRNKKAKGLEHYNHKNQLIPARKVGPNCGCKHFKCYDKISQEERELVLRMFNDLGNKDDQDAYLIGLISVIPIARYTTNDPKKFRISSFSYKIRFKQEEHKVCAKTFGNIHGIKPARIRRLRDCLMSNIIVPKDQRGKHSANRVKKTPEPLLNLIRYHISSFKARQSHYSRRDNPNTFYLSEELNVRKMYDMFLDSFKINISYMIYWTVFNKEFNLKFGLPRTDTCAICDSYNLKKKLAVLPGTVNILHNEHQLHLMKAEEFHRIKRAQKAKAQQGLIMCLSFDFMQNLPTPHIRTGDVFYSRQLWNYVFGIHDLSNNHVTLNSYIETEGKKGQNNVTSLLMKYFNEHDVTSKNLVLLSDSCPGQNKNYVMIQFLFALVHIFQLFESIQYVFPIRGHSYLPNDQDFSLIGSHKKKVTVETPIQWDEIMQNARRNPTPFEVKRVTHDMFYDIKKSLELYFLKQPKPPMKLKDVRMIKIEKTSNFIYVKYHYSGAWSRINVRSRRQLPTELSMFTLYEHSLPLNPNKKKDLINLKQYLSDPLSLAFYDSLLADNVLLNNESESDLDNEDNSSGEE